MREAIGADEIRQRLPVDAGCAGEDGHLLSVTTIGTSIRYLTLLESEVLS